MSDNMTIDTTADDYSPSEDGDPCADCGRPVWYDEERGDWFHMVPGECFLATYRPKPDPPACCDECGEDLSLDPVAVVKTERGSYCSDSCRRAMGDTDCDCVEGVCCCYDCCPHGATVDNPCEGNCG